MRCFFLLLLQTVRYMRYKWRMRTLALDSSACPVTFGSSWAVRFLVRGKRGATRSNILFHVLYESDFETLRTVAPRKRVSSAQRQAKLHRTGSGTIRS
jgi:hypothetical protein